MYKKGAGGGGGGVGGGGGRRGRGSDGGGRVLCVRPMKDFFPLTICSKWKKKKKKKKSNTYQTLYIFYFHDNVIISEMQKGLRTERCQKQIISLTRFDLYFKYAYSHHQHCYLFRIFFHSMSPAELEIRKQKYKKWKRTLQTPYCLAVWIVITSLF